MTYPSIQWTLLILAILITESLAVGEQLPPSCTAPAPDRLEQDGLKSNDPMVEHRVRYFRHDAHDYPIETFSRTDPEPKSYTRWRNGEVPVPMQCFRYEAKNIGHQDITQFYWNLMGDIEHTLQSGKRDSRVRQLPTKDPPTVGITTLYAFRNSKAQSEVHRVTEEGKEQAAKDLPSVGMYSVATRQPSIAPLFRQVAIDPSEPVIAYEDLFRTIFLDPLIDTFVTEKIGISVTTSARFTGYLWHIEIKVEPTVTMEDRAEIYAPQFLALEGQPKNVKEFLLSLPKVRSTPLKLAGNTYSAMFEFRQMGESPTQNLYVVEHPISVLVGRQWYCVRVLSYSPFPVPIPATYCHESVSVSK